MLFVVMLIFVCLAISELALTYGSRVIGKGIEPDHQQRAESLGLVFDLIGMKLSSGVPRGPRCGLMLWGEFLVLCSIVSPDTPGDRLRTRIAAAYALVFHFLGRTLAYVSPRLERLALLELIKALQCLVSMTGKSFCEAPTSGL